MLRKALVLSWKIAVEPRKGGGSACEFTQAVEFAVRHDGNEQFGCCYGVDQAVMRRVAWQ